MSRKLFNLVRSVGCVLNGSTESAVTAFWLHSKGYPVTGISLYNIYQPPELNAQQKQFAADVCNHLDIEYTDVSLSNELWEPFNRAVADDFKKGLNPDINVLFTKHILTGSFVDHCTRVLSLASIALPFSTRSDYGFDGALSSKIQGTRLLKAIDRANDDSYFLSQTPGKTLTRFIFPLGELPKEAIAMMANISSLDVIPTCPSSTGLVDPALIPDSLKPQEQKGKFIDLLTGKTINYHESFHKYYPGLCVELNGQNFYVVEKNIKSHDVYLVEDPDHPACFADTFFTSLANWIHKTPHHFYHEKQMMDCAFRMSRDAPLVNCSITVGALNEYCGNDHIIVSSAQPVKAIVPGQFCAFYQGEECIGSGSIFKSGPTHYAMNYKKYKPQGQGKNGWKGLFT